MAQIVGVYLGVVAAITALLRTELICNILFFLSAEKLNRAFQGYFSGQFNNFFFSAKRLRYFR